MSSSIEIVKYDSSFEEKWDKFIVNSSVNGTFLQSRKFLNYHPAGRFNDHSLLIMKGTNIVGLVPMHVVEDGDTRKFYSHLGSTFGGILLNANSLEVAALKEIFDQKQHKQITAELIMRTVSDYYGLSLSEMTGATRKREITVPRQIAMYLTREMTGMSLPQIGTVIGGRDHTTVLHGYKTVESNLKTNDGMRSMVENIKQLVKSAQ